MTVSDLNTPIAQRIAASLARQGMMTHLDAQLLRVEKGEVEVALPFGDKVTQQQGGFHGGAIGAQGKKSMCAVMQQTLVPVPQNY